MLLQKTTEIAVNDFLRLPSHAVLLAGPVGTGKRTLADSLAVSLLDQDLDKLKTSSKYLAIEPIKNVIALESIRSTQKFIRLKTIGDKRYRRVLIVEDADLMTREAQNAFLKVLEEPPADTVIILTSSHPHNLLPTILSRVQVLRVQPIEQDQLTKHFEDLGYQATDITSAYYLSGGSIGLMSDLLSPNEEHSLTKAIKQTKEILSKSRFERLTLVNELAADKETLQTTLQALEKIAYAALKQSVTTGNTKLTKLWLKTLNKAIAAQDLLSKNVQPKLLLSDLFMQV